MGLFLKMKTNLWYSRSWDLWHSCDNNNKHRRIEKRKKRKGQDYKENFVTSKVIDRNLIIGAKAYNMIGGVKNHEMIPFNMTFSARILSLHVLKQLQQFPTMELKDGWLIRMITSLNSNIHCCKKVPLRC